MAEIVIAPATADRFDDAEHALSGGGDGHSCQCQWWTITNAEFQQASLDERRELLRTEIEDDAPPPALIAYVDGEAAGWVRVGRRAEQLRIARTREIAANTPIALDDPGVWAVTCFVVRREHRGQGLNAKLLAAAIDYARDHGARTIEAYPLDPSAAKKPTNQLFRGVLSVFEAAGFTEVARPKPDRAIVALDLAAAEGA
ncbi:Acetyltransferase (GNAT) family protein [Microbacterium sp. cf046]|uniref:GNAT family N-acetyltransferase n=1 Tax=Microbacterium sp. cf046 TaxID=1761803 RepID=UPI0008ECADD8|nr:GNAT family N-acetyltransferase [Microbacterium sp. cf046]SFS02355.1 Acetyltransferase (GNAT) family protein [Microbacterium sp. cf046]